MHGLLPSLWESMTPTLFFLDPGQLDSSHTKHRLSPRYSVLREWKSSKWRAGVAFSLNPTTPAILNAQCTSALLILPSYFKYVHLRVCLKVTLAPSK
jgi:hypothetical protein